MMPLLEADTLISLALREDIGDGDITTSAVIQGTAVAAARLIAQQRLVVAGLDIVQRVFEKLDPEVKVRKNRADGEAVATGDVVLEVEGSVAALLAGERIALNFIQRLSGIATLTESFVARVRSYPVKICDTRKTTPGWRALEKYAVKMGGGTNHRIGLFDAVLIKDNHIKAAGSIEEAVRRVKAKLPAGFPVEVETRTLAEVREALASGANTIMLDNMGTAMMREAVTLIDKRAIIEASGNVRLETVETIAATGVDFISVGALTHSAPAVDISMKISS
jgi:nicotinate-nucleotide pyrophosphorylase (carboxylating)